MKRHCKEKSEKCNQCGFACHNQLKNINGESQYHCNQCDFACSRANISNVHVYNTQRRKIKQLLSIMWQYIYHFQSSENTHWRSAQQMQSVQLCSLWNSWFESTHDGPLMAYCGEKPHKCYLCKYSASLEGNLKRHMKICHQWYFLTYSTYHKLPW